MAGWRIKLEEYDYKIIYKKRNLNSNADVLSRNIPPLDKFKRICLKTKEEMKKILIDNHNSKLV